MQVQCPGCGTRCVPPGHIGEQAFRCPGCGMALRVPLSPVAPALAAKPAPPPLPPTPLTPPPPPQHPVTRSPSDPAQRSAPRKPAAGEQAAKPAPPSPPQRPAARTPDDQAPQPAPSQSRGKPKPPAPPPAAAPSLVRWRRFVTLGCLVLSLFILSASAGVAGWRLYERGRATTRARAGLWAERQEEPTPSERPAPGPAPIPVPDTADVYGGIEIGSKAVKAVVIRLRQTPGQPVTFEHVVPEDTTSTTLVNQLEANGTLDPRAVSETANAVDKYLQGFERKHGLPKERTYVLVASGVFSPIKDKPALVADNKRYLAETLKKKIGREPVFVDVRMEAELTFQAAVAPGREEDALLLDVGSGSTKVCFRNGKTLSVSLEVPYGTKTFADAADRRVRDLGGTFTRQLSDLPRDDERWARFQEEVRRYPGVPSLSRVYLAGGVVWATMTLQRPGDRGAYVTFKASDLEALARRLEERADGPLPEPDLTGLSVEAKQQVEKDLRRLRGIFDRKQLLAGVRLVQALLADFGGTSDPRRELIFPRDAYVGLLVFYSLRLQGERSGPG